MNSGIEHKRVERFDKAFVAQAAEAVLERLEARSNGAQQDAVRQGLAETERRLQNLTAAIAEGGSVPTLVESSRRTRRGVDRLLSTCAC
jgi:hypothetical protein